MLEIFERWNVVEMTELHIARHWMLIFDGIPHTPLHTQLMISEYFTNTAPAYYQSALPNARKILVSPFALFGDSRLRVESQLNVVGFP